MSALTGASGNSRWRLPPMESKLADGPPKVRWSGGELVVCDRWFPSTRTCHLCGRVKRHLKVEERTFRCQRCGNSCDRDQNAAANLAPWAERSDTPDRQADGQVNNVPGGNGAGHRLADGGPVPDEGGTEAQATAGAKGHPRRMASVTTAASDML
jgi:putative transposase